MTEKAKKYKNIKETKYMLKTYTVKWNSECYMMNSIHMLNSFTLKIIRFILNIHDCLEELVTYLIF